MMIVSLFGGSNESMNSEDKKLLTINTDTVTDVGKGVFQIFPPPVSNSTNDIMAKN